MHEFSSYLFQCFEDLGSFEYTPNCHIFQQSENKFYCYNLLA